MSDAENNEWAGFSDFENVASQLHKDVNRAVRAYAHINSKSTQGVGITPQTAVRTKSAILSIAKKLHFEVGKNMKDDDGLREIHERWAGVKYIEADRSGEEYEVENLDDEGYISELEDADFTREVPDWLGDMVLDIIAAAWELGYTKAGIERPGEPDSPEEEVAGMFES